MTDYSIVLLLFLFPLLFFFAFSTSGAWSGDRDP